MNEWPAQRAVEVADGVVAILHGQGDMGVANSAFIVDGDEAIVVDTMTLPRMAAGIAREIARRGATVRSVVNTHHHIDHIGGNQVFAGARFYAHPTTMRTMERSDYSPQACERLLPRFSGHFDENQMLFPREPIDDIALPQDAQALAFTPAHTPADVAVWLPDSRVLLAGDLCFVGVTPLVVHGLVSGWIAALDQLIALRPSVVVPGHGAIGGPEDLITVRAYFVALQEMGRRAVAEGIALADAVDAFDAGPVAEWLEPRRTMINIDRAMQEARGEISRTTLSTFP